MLEANIGMAKYRCDYCQCDISGIRVKCAECKDFDLCLQCFSCGAEIGPHRNDHSYGIAGGSDINAFDSPKLWTLSEETMLLDAVEQYGFGNWEDAASHVESALPSECEQHYINYYIHGNIGKVTFQTETENKITDHTCPDGGPLSPSITVPVTPVDLSPQEQQELGYMPYRDDFEREFDNEAEGSISALSNNYDDDELDITIKLIQVDRYRLRIKEREQRKRIAREYGLISAATTAGSKQKAQQPKKKKAEREFQEKMRIFSQFHLAAEHEAYFENLQKSESETDSEVDENIGHDSTFNKTTHSVLTRATEMFDFEYRDDKESKCKCQIFEGEQCIKQFTEEECISIRLNITELTSYEKDLLLLGMIAASCNDSDNTLSTKQKNSARKQTRIREFRYGYRRICRDAFLHLMCISKDKLTALKKHYVEHGLIPRKKQSEEKELKARIKEMMKLRKNGLTTPSVHVASSIALDPDLWLNDVETYEEEKYKREKKKENRKKTPNQAKRNSMVPKKLAVEEKLDILIDDDDIKDEEEEEEEEDRKEMAQLPGYDMLSEREKKLCNSIGMTPANYVTIKTCIIKDYIQRRQGLPVKIRYPSGLDKTHRRKIMSFLTDNGWIGVT